MAATRPVYEAASSLEPFQVLTAEHALIRLQISRALEAARRDPSAAATRRTLAALEEGFRVHQRREDLVMYPLCERLFGGKDGVASVLRDDHATIRGAFARVASDGGPVGPISADGLEGLRDLVEAHFAREEKVLFPLMTAHLDGRAAADLARRLRAARAS